MPAIFIPSKSPEDWRQYLASPGTQWKDGCSAKELAYAWGNADGWPEDVRDLFEECPDLTELTPLLAIPEHTIPLPGGGKPSQNDLFVLAGDNEGLVTIMVEGKAAEPFGQTLSDWLRDASQGKTRRLAYLRKILGLPDNLPGSIRYQLLHRATSALIEGRRFHARAAVVLIHSFSLSNQWFNDYADFLELFGVDAEPGRLHTLIANATIPLYVGWVSSAPRTAPSEASDKQF